MVNRAEVSASSAQVDRTSQKPWLLRLPKFISRRFSSTPETVESVERDVVRIIERVENAYLERYPDKQREAGSRQGFCIEMSDLVEYVTKHESSLNVVRYPVQRIHKHLGGPEEIVNAFGHDFSIVGNKEEKFLVDLSYSQFLDSLGYIHVGDRESKIKSNHPVAQALLEKGYIRLTEENFREYLRITTLTEDPSHLSTVTLDDLNQVRSHVGIDDTRIREKYPSLAVKRSS